MVARNCSPVYFTSVVTLCVVKRVVGTTGLCAPRRPSGAAEASCHPPKDLGDSCCCWPSCGASAAALEHPFDGGQGQAILPSSCRRGV